MNNANGHRVNIWKTDAGLDWKSTIGKFTTLYFILYIFILNISFKRTFVVPYFV